MKWAIFRRDFIDLGKILEKYRKDLLSISLFSQSLLSVFSDSMGSTSKE